MASFKAKDVVKILQKLGFIVKRQSGSHLVMYNPQTKKNIVVPIHNKDLKHGLVKGIIKEVNSSEKEFIELK